MASSVKCGDGDGEGEVGRWGLRSARWGKVSGSRDTAAVVSDEMIDMDSSVMMMR